MAALFGRNADDSAESDSYLPRKGAHGHQRPHDDVEAIFWLLHACPGLKSNRRKQMQNLSPRHVKTEEALRLGVLSGWYSTKVSGTFVSGPHDSEADCQHRINEINPPPKKRKF
jgi:hypothetical protein